MNNPSHYFPAVLTKQKSGRARPLAWLALACLGALPAARGQGPVTLTTLHTFNSGSSGDPTAGLALGSDGDLYGTTSGGTSGDGSVFKITAAGVFTNLYTFGGGTDGQNPSGGLVQGGSASNFYGTTTGGTNTTTGGTVFRVTTAGALTTLYTFTGSTDGSTPVAGLILDGSTFIGTTSGGSTGYGTVFEIMSTGSLETVYDFTGGSDGSDPTGSLIVGGDGNLYGTTKGGGAYGDGTVFRITPAGALTTIHSFDASDGSYPAAGLAKPGDGYFYGTTQTGGSGNGTVFRITTTGEFTTLHTFNGGDGSAPVGSLLPGSDGNLYGTTTGGGTNNDGTVFRITTAGVFTSLYSFSGASDGSTPVGGLVEDGHDNFYGTTSSGGADNDGTVFVLSVHPAFFDGEVALGGGVYYLAFAGGDYFGYYSFLTDANYLYHFDLGFEYVFDASDANDGVYLYDFKSSDYFYTSPSFPFPYLYDFGLKSVVYYYPDPGEAGHYNTDGVRYFYVFNTGQIISK